MSILNVLLRPDQLLVAVDTLAEDALTGAPSAGAKLLLIPQHNLVLATRGSAQFFLRVYELALQASFRADFTMEQLGRELGLVVDQLWPSYERAALDASIPREALGTELVLGGGHPARGAWWPPPMRKATVAWPRWSSRLSVGLHLLGSHCREGPTASRRTPFWLPPASKRHGSTRPAVGMPPAAARWSPFFAKAKRSYRTLARFEPSSRPLRPRGVCSGTCSLPAATKASAPPRFRLDGSMRVTAGRVVQRKGDGERGARWPARPSPLHERPEVLADEGCARGQCPAGQAIR